MRLNLGLDDRSTGSDTEGTSVPAKGIFARTVSVLSRRAAVAATPWGRPFFSTSHFVDAPSEPRSGVMPAGARVRVPARALAP